MKNGKMVNDDSDNRPVPISEEILKRLQKTPRKKNKVSNKEFRDYLKK